MATDVEDSYADDYPSPTAAGASRVMDSTARSSGEMDTDRLASQHRSGPMHHANANGGDVQPQRHAAAAPGTRGATAASTLQQQSSPGPSSPYLNSPTNGKGKGGHVGTIKSLSLIKDLQVSPAALSVRPTACSPTWWDQV